MRLLRFYYSYRQGFQKLELNHEQHIFLAVTNNTINHHDG